MDKKHYIHELPDGSYRDSTEQEITAALKVQKEYDALVIERDKIEERIRTISKTCTHKVCYDEPSFIYDTRTCVRCGYQSLI